MDPAVIFYAVLNAVEPNFLLPLTLDTGITRFFIGDTGMAVTIGCLSVAYLFWRRRASLPET